MTQFHAKDGWHFERLASGAVEVTHGEDDTVTLDADTWGSIVAAVSVSGDTAGTFARARALHDGTTVETEGRDA